MPYSRKTSATIPIENTGSLLLDRIAITLRDTGYFRQVFPSLVPPNTLQCPAAIILPQGEEVPDAGISNTTIWIQYNFQLGVGLRGHAEERITKQVMSIRQILGGLFTDLVFEDVKGHFQTEVVREAITMPEIVGQGVLIFGTGLTIQMKVQNLKQEQVI